MTNKSEKQGRMKLPKSIWAVIVVMLLYGGGNIYWFSTSRNWTHIIFVVLSVFGILGIIFRIRSSQYCIYLLFLMLGAAMIFNSTQQIVNRGWPYDNTFANLMGMILPSLIVVALCIGFSVSVYVFFRKIASSISNDG